MLQPLFFQALGAFGRVETLNHIRDVFREIRALVAWDVYPHSWAKRVCGCRKNLQDCGIELQLGLELLQFSSLCPNDFDFPLSIRWIERVNWAVQYSSCFWKISFLYPSSQMSLWLVMCGNEEEKRREILLRDKGQCCVPSARARQWSMGRAHLGFIVASRFSALAIFLSK